MKKINKVLVLIASLILMMNVSSSFVQAQETNNLDIYTQIQEANQDIQSATGNFNLKLAVQDTVDGTLSGDFKFSLDPLAFELDGSLAADIVSQGQDGESTTMPINFPGQIVLVDNQIYIYDGYSLTQEDASEFVVEFEKIYEEAMAQQVQATSPELMEKYYNLEETETEYIVSMKEDIDPDEFMEDVSAEVDLEQVKQDSYETALEQFEEEAKANEQELTDEDYQEFEDTFNKSWDAGLKIGITLIDSMEMKYNKDTLLLSYMLMNMSLTGEELQEVIATMGEEVPAEELENINLEISYEMNVDESNIPVEISAPEMETSAEEDAELEETTAE